MLEPIQSGSHAVTSAEALNALLIIKGIVTLEISGEATLEFATITKVITQNRDSIVTLTLNGGSREFTISLEASEALAGAVQSCGQLRSLTIKNFFNSFREHIKYFCLCLKNHPELKALSFQNTFLGEYATDLFKSLETHTNLKKINLCNTALIYSANWNTLTQTLRNSSLEVLDLRGNATRLLAVESVLHGIVSVSNKIRILKWSFTELREAETLHWESDKLVNWENDKERDRQVNNCLNHLATHRPGQHILETNYRVAKVKFADLMAFIAERNDPTPKTCLSITISNEHHFDLKLLTVRIARHSKSLRELNIVVDSLEYSNPFTSASDPQFSLFINTLRSCTALCELKLEHLQGIFKGESMVTLLHAATSLPRLQVFSLNKTYVGPAGMKALAELMRKNIITRLDLTLSALVNSYCFEMLATAIQSNTSLETLILGKSPMTAMWLQILTQGVRARNANTPLCLVWIASEQDTMESQMLAMCNDLIDSFNKEDHRWKKTILGLYYDQRTVDLTPNWLKLQRHIKASTYQQLSGVLPPQNPKREQGVAIEMKPVATPSSHLLNRPKASYGTAASVNTTSKDTKSGLSL